MIDLHTHILPGIDDGSDSCEVSRKMLETLQRDGVDKVVFTPHFYWRQNTVKHFLEARNAAWEQLKAAGIPEGMEIHLGAEAEFNEMSVAPSSLAPLAIDGGKYILLELPFTPDWSPKLFNRLENLIYSADFIPVIAHVERYPAARKNPAYIAKLSGMGCLIQVNCETARNVGDQKLADILFRHGQVHCLGSDCHNMTTRKPDYAEAIDALRIRYGETCVAALQENMEHVLRGEPVFSPPPYTLRKALFGKYR